MASGCIFRLLAWLVAGYYRFVKKKAKSNQAEHMRTIGAKGGSTTKRRKGKSWFSRIAKLSHPRKKYFGGRKKADVKVSKS